MPAVFYAVFASIGEVLGYFGPAVPVFLLQTDDCVILLLCPAALLVFFRWAGIETLPALLTRAAIKM